MDVALGAEGPIDVALGAEGPMDVAFGADGPMDVDFGAEGPLDVALGAERPMDVALGAKGSMDVALAAEGPMKMLWCSSRSVVAIFGTGIGWNAREGFSTPVGRSLESNNGRALGSEKVSAPGMFGVEVSIS